MSEFVPPFGGHLEFARMAINITCPGCQSVYPVGENLVGKTIRCKKCGEMMPVTAPAAPVAARPARPVGKAAVVVDDGDDALPPKPVRRGGRDYGDDDDAPRSRPARGAKGERKGSKLPLILGAVIGLIVLGAAGVGVAFATGMFGGSDTQPTDVVGVTPPDREPVTPPAVTKPDSGTEETTAEGTKPAGTQAKSTTTGGLAPPITITNTNPVPPPPAPSGLASSTSISQEQLMSGRMDRETIARVAKATILIEGEGHNGERWTGSGWFGMEPGLVFTNAHVLNMKAPDSKEPAKLTFHMYRPDPSAQARISLYKTIPHQRIKILAVDRRNDLAVLKVENEPDLPIPLKVRPSAELQPRQGVTVFGFPLTGTLAKIADLSKDRQPEMSVRPTNVTSYRVDDVGRPKVVQTEGGQNSGNSGGPIVDAEGYVVAVVVAGVLQDGQRTPLSLSVPTEYVFGLLAGRVDEVEFDQAYNKDGKVHIPVTAKILDPLNRLKKVGIWHWVGDAGKDPRPPGDKKAEKTPADGEHRFVELTYDPKKKVATGEIVAEPLPPGRAYWTQPFYTNALRPNGYYDPGLAMKLTGPPVDRVPTDLLFKPQFGTTRPIELATTSDLSEYVEGESESKEERMLLKTTLKMTEAVRPGVAQQGAAANLLFKFQNIDLKAQFGRTDVEIIPKRLMEILNQNLARMEAMAMVNNKGEIFRYQDSIRDVPNPIYGLILKQFTSDTVQSLQQCSIPLPNRQRVNAMESWESRRTNRLFLFSDLNSISNQQPVPGGRQVELPKPKELRYDEVVTYTYLGTRKRLGTTEAVIKIDGKVQTSAGSKEAASGYIRGYAMIEIATGTVVSSEIDSEFEIDSSSKGLRKKLSGVKKYSLTRGSAIR